MGEETIEVEIEYFQGEKLNVVVGYKKGNSFSPLMKLSYKLIDELIEKLREVKYVHKH